MRRHRLAAVAIAAGALIAGVTGTSPAAAATTLTLPKINNVPLFRAARVELRLEPVAAPGTLKVGSSTAVLTAQVRGWKSPTGKIAAPRPGVVVTFSVLSGPDAGLRNSAKTDTSGFAQSTIVNKTAPGTDAVQATYSDGLEIHKSQRVFVLWQSGPAASAIRSPAQITVTPGCFQPAGAALATSNSFQVVPPSLKKAAAAIPASQNGTITVKGDNFNPFSAVLLTFDAGPGGRPQNFEASTDGFGHFERDIVIKEPQEGVHLVRADDFRRREADTTYQVPCLMPSVALDPPIGPPGFVSRVVGTGFPPDTDVVVANWMSPDLASPLCKSVRTDKNGAFECPVLILYHDILGPRMLQAIVPNPNGPNAGAAIEADAPFLVTPGRSQPSDLVVRR